MNSDEIKSVFGVRKDMVKSYVDRKSVDDKFIAALNDDKHIVVYGASKQGKSALVKKHLKEKQYVTVNCSTQMVTKDIYQSILRQIGVRIETSYEKTKEHNAEMTVKTGFKAILPFLGNANVSGEGILGDSNKSTVSETAIEFNLELAQDICEVLKTCKFDKWVLIENFHYLDNEIQQLFAVDLRIFQDMGYKFIILGIWRERNRLMQFNRDLMDRLIEIPVEPWTKEDFAAVIKKGTDILKITICPELIEKIEENGFGNIGIVQELCKNICLCALEKDSNFSEIEDEELLEKAILDKVEDYSASHMRSFETLANSSIYKNGLYMPYHLIKIIVNYGTDKLVNGIPKKELQTLFNNINEKEVRASDITHLLNNLANLQLKCKISPPLFDYDGVGRQLRVIDSTLLFFLKFRNGNEILDDISNPMDNRMEDE